VLGRHPLLLAEWLAVRNRIARAKGRAAVLVALGIAIVVALIVVLATLASQVGSVFANLNAYRVLTVASVALYAALVIARRRQHAEARYMQFWLAAAPVRPYSRTLAILVVSAIPLAAQLVVACVLFAAMGAVGNVEAAVVGEATLSIVVATVIGMVIGWWFARRSRVEAYEGSRYAGAIEPRSESIPTLAALSAWPLAQVRAWGRPENLRVLVLIPALFAVQAGSSALHGLSVIAIWVLGGYLGGLLNAVSHTARGASDWLRSTPIPFAQFAWAVARRALLHQVIGTSVAAAVLISLGAPLQSVLYAGALWLSIVMLSCCITLVEHYRSRPSLVRTVLSFATLAVVEVREHGWSIPLAALLAAWHLRAGAKT
jgi:hypothetical protein